MKRRISNFKECVEEIKKHALWELDMIIPVLKKKKVGRNGFYIPCPFHNDSKPSHTINRTFFYCFGCQCSGSIIDFYMLISGGSFFQAVRDLCVLFKIKTKWENVK